VAGLGGVGGVASAAAWSQLRPAEVLRTIERLSVDASHVVVDVAGGLEDLPITMARPRHAVARAIVAEASHVVAVGEASPVGMARLLAWIGAARLLAAETPLYAVVNRAPKDAFRRGECVDAVADTFAIASVTFVPNDPRVSAAAWAGEPVTSRRFTRAIDELARAVHTSSEGERRAS